MSGGENGQQRVIDGRFALEARLGGGGMGTVWRARDLVLDRAVALKEVRPPDPALVEYDPEGARTLRARVLREARALARVDHPNVVTIHHVVDSGEDGYPWLVMELVTGGSLQDRLARGPMEPAEVAALGREVLAALRAAHAAGIQHRDVKPANVLLRPDGRPVLTDFGIAAIRESTALTTTGSLIGTPDYMAPERIMGEDGGPGADLWSLAMMLYVAVEGRHPLRRATTMATLAAVLSEEVPPPHRAGPLTGLLNALLVKDPGARPGPEHVDGMLAAVLRAAGRADPAPPGAVAGPGFGPATDPATGSGAATRPVSGSGAWDGATAGAAGEPEVTSYRLTPPVSAGARDLPGTGPGTAAPRPGASPGRARRSRNARMAAIGMSAVGTVLTGVLVWSMLPDDGTRKASGTPLGAGKGPSAASAPPSTPPLPASSSSSSSPSSSSSAGSGAATSRTTSSGAPADRDRRGRKDLLDPDAIRRGIAELTAEMGTDRVAGFSVYPDYISVRPMVEGSDTKYNSYMYRPGEEIVRTPIRSTLTTTQRPVRLSEFDWDAVPELLARADRDLNVEKPTLRYITVRLPQTVFQLGPAMLVYLTDDYGGGYLEADARGRVSKLYPASG
ncbi:serine/threonine-protein kinase [Streptomyces clavuligerus]|nr:serine/threonine-protein kinase [Streptomyces clavuligerus]ANW21791.1 serine/threonine protein kinase [Streptomyces clavuligerus]AXU16421.1 serine/threonine protein kinase [Streptomyces clavuligerus]MBY6301858.1 protein kinase [Streptomyces clavuligerus]QCS09184.1 serine/threonine protein kinase [Streptomyces clavuligerus]QPJ95839.1 protein kinase [Streptomyces clavuligerus]